MAGLFGSLFGGGDSTSTQTNAPWQKAQPFVMKGLKESRDLYNSGSGFNVPGFQTYVPMSGQTKQALGGIWDMAKNGGNPMAGASQDTIMGILGSDPISPYFRDMTQRNAQQMYDDIANQFSMGGRYGSGAMVDNMSQNVGNFINDAYAGQYNQGIANQMAAIQAMPGVYEQQFAPYEKMGQVGAAYDDLNTRKLQAKLDKFYAKDMQKQNRLNAYLGQIGQGTAGTGTSTGTVTPPANPFGGAIGGAMMGGQMLGLPGAIGGGILGLLQGL